MGIQQRNNVTTIDNLTVKTGGTLVLTGVTVTGLTASVTGNAVAVNSIADMVALSVSNNTLVQVLGYNTRGDGYTALWIYIEDSMLPTDGGSVVNQISEGQFLRVFDDFAQIKASEFGLFPNITITADMMNGWFNLCKSTGAEAYWDMAGIYVIPDDWSMTFQNDLSVLLNRSVVISSYTGSNFANRQPEFIDVTLNGAKFPNDTYFRVRYTAKDAVVHSTFSALTPIMLDEYLHKDGDGNWSKRTKAQMIAQNFLIPIDVGYVNLTTAYTNGGNTISTTSTRGFVVGDVLVSAGVFPVGTKIVSVTGGGSSWTATVNTDATGTGTAAFGYFAELPAIDGYYIVEKTRDTYSGSLNPKTAIQFSPALDLTHGMVIRRNAGVWSIVNMPTMFYMENGASLSISGGKFDSLTQHIFDYDHTTTAKTLGKSIRFDSEVHNVNRVLAKTQQAGSISGGTINFPEIQEEKLNPCAYKDMYILQTRFSNIGHSVASAIQRIDNLYVDNITIENSSSMLVGIYTVNALNVHYSNVNCNFLANRDDHNGLWLRGGQLSTSFNNVHFNQCAGIMLYASGNKLQINNISADGLNYPNDITGSTALLLKGGHNSTEMIGSVSNVFIKSMYSAAIGVVRDSPLQFNNITIKGALLVALTPETPLNEKPTNGGISLNKTYEYEIIGSTGLTRFETVVNVNYRDTSIVEGDKIYFDPKINRWVKNIYSYTPSTGFSMSMGLSHENQFQSHQISNSLFEVSNLTRNIDRVISDFIFDNCISRVREIIGVGQGGVNAAQSVTINGGKLYLYGSPRITSTKQIHLNHVDIYKRKADSLNLVTESGEVYINGLKIFNHEWQQESNNSNYVIMVTAAKFRAIGVISETNNALGKMYQLTGCTDILVEGGYYNLTSNAAGDLVSSFVDIINTNNINTLDISNIKIQFGDYTVRKLVTSNVASGAIAQLHFVGNKYNFDPTLELDGADTTVSMYNSIGNVHSILAASVTNATRSMSRIKNFAD